MRALAKINLDLQVLHKRADGYHELRTVFQTISLADTLEVEFTPGAPHRASSWQSDLEIPDNLVLRAARLAHGRDARAPGGSGSGCASAFRWAPGWAAGPATPPRCCWRCPCWPGGGSRWTR